MTAAKFVVSNLSTKIMLFPLSFLSSIVIARLLGAEGKGVYAYIIVLSSFLIPLFSFGFINGIRYYIAKKKYSVKKSGFTIFICGALISLLICMTLLVLLKFELLGKVAQMFNPNYVIFLVVLVFFKTFVLFSQGMLNSDGQFIFNNKQNLINGTLTPLLIIPLVFFFEDKVLGAILATSLTFAVMLTNIILFVKKRYNPILKLNNDFVIDSYKYGIKGWPGYVAINANTRLDRFLLGVSTTATSLGNYSVATSLSEIIWVLPNSVGPVFFNKVAESNDGQERLNLLVKINRLLLFSGVIIGGIFVIILAEFIPLLYGNDFLDAVLPFIILVPGTVIMILTKTLVKLFTGTGNIIYTTYTQVGGAIITITLCLFLIPLYGIMGAAVSSTIGYAITSFIAIYFYKQKYNGSIRALFFLKMSDILWVIKQIKSIIRNK